MFPDVFDKLVSLCKRRAFIFQSSEIYGGTGSVWDYGPLGVELKKNLKDRWWHAMVRARDDIEGLDAAILMHPRVWEASGHVAGFTDPLVDCKACKARFRADQIGEAQCPRKPSKHPGEHTDCQLTEPRLFNLMFKTFMGPVEDSAAVVYLRPETAQGIYVNFLNVQQATRQKVPFGIAQIGKAFRNEITPGNFIFRTREFEQMEMQFFVDPQQPSGGRSDMEWFEYWKEQRLLWHLSLGLERDRLKFHQHTPQELAHYARAAFDVQFDFGGGLGFQEIEGVHHRGDFDLTQHQQYSGKRLEYLDQPANRRYVPYVIEPAAGAAHPSIARADQGRDLPAGQEGRDAGVRGKTGRGPSPAFPGVLRRVRSDRPQVSPAGRSRHAILPDRRRPDDPGSDGHRSRPRHARAGARGGGPRARVHHQQDQLISATGACRAAAEAPRRRC
jgi:glycyl-tRNA synthetase